MNKMMPVIQAIERKLQKSIYYLAKKELNLIQDGFDKFMFFIYNSEKIPKSIPKKVTRIESVLKTYSPLVIIFTVLLTIYIMKMICNLNRKIAKFYKNSGGIKNIIFNIVVSLPSNKKKLAEKKVELKKTLNDIFKNSKFKKINFENNRQSKDTILSKLQAISKVDEVASSVGTITGSVYCGSEDIHHLASQAAETFLYSNLIHPQLFCGARFIESQLIKIGLDLFNAKEGACGMTTTGGTFSLITATYCYIRRGKAMGIENPNIVVPMCAHTAFSKAAKMFGCEIIRIPLDPYTYQVDLKKLKKAINKNTVMIVGSFPCFPHCVADDIEALSQIALKYKVGLHVDCCLGGFLAGFFDHANIKHPKFDFRLPGVTSISADLHKYGLCPKGISLVMFASHELREYNYFIYTKWMGGLYCSASFDGSRTAGLAAASYAILTHLGKDYYAKITKDINAAIKKVVDFMNKEITNVHVVGMPFICGFAFIGDKAEFYYDEMSRRKWVFNYINDPVGCSFVFTSANVGNVDKLIKDLRETNKLIEEGKIKDLEEMTKLYGMVVPYPEDFTSKLLNILVDSMLD